MAKRGRRPTYVFEDEACPNPTCPLYGKKGGGNIVSNGTYETRKGGKARRFVCTCWDESFCSNTGAVFYDLRTPKDKVLLGIKLLVKGMPLRGIAEVLEVKLDTVRHWLRVAAEQSEKVDELLLGKGKVHVSQVELDALWTFVKKKALRERARLWRERSGLGLRLPRNIG